MLYVKAREGGWPPLAMHIVYRLGVGGLENGLVNLINHMPQELYRHSIVCLTDFTDFRNRIQRENVPVIALHKRAGNDPRIYAQLWSLYRAYKPDIVHTRNLSGLEYLIPAALAGIPGRIHGEHGLDFHELHGSNFKYNLLRKVSSPVVSRYIAVSADLERWMVRDLSISPNRVCRIYNGVDHRRFQPRTTICPPVWPVGFAPPGSFVIGTVGRMEKVKDQLTLVRAFLRLIGTEPQGARRLRLVMVGDGSLREEARRLVRSASADNLVWLPGELEDIPELMKSLDLFVLPSLREGISNTILEAMATGLAVIATRVGGNPELVEDGVSGMLVPPADPLAMAEAVRSYLSDPVTLTRHGRAGRQRVESQFTMEAMVRGYLAVYDSVLNGQNQN